MLPKRRLGDDAYVCERCEAALPKSAFANVDWRGGSHGEPRYHMQCGPCQVEADDGFGVVTDDSAWVRAEKEVERRYGIPHEQWLSVADTDRYRPLATLWLRLAQQYAAEQRRGLHPRVAEKFRLKLQITVEDSERLCRAHGLMRVDGGETLTVEETHGIAS